MQLYVIVDLLIEQVNWVGTGRLQFWFRFSIVSDQGLIQVVYK